MGGWLPQSPWRIIDGSGQALTVPNGGHVESSAVGAETRAVALSVITGNCLVRISKASIASVSLDFLIKTTDPPIILGCSPGDKVSAWGLAAGTLQMCELTH